MAKKDQGYQNLYDKFSLWLNDVKEHEVASMVEMVQRAKEYLHAAEDLTEDEMDRSLYGLKRDLNQFYQQSKEEAKSSVYLKAMAENVWESLAKLTDKSKVEWAELVEDFDHEGVYQAGELVGFGKVICTQCHYEIEIVHPSELMACPDCGNTSYIRQGLAP